MQWLARWKTDLEFGGKVEPVPIFGKSFFRCVVSVRQEIASLCSHWCVNRYQDDILQ